MAAMGRHYRTTTQTSIIKMRVSTSSARNSNYKVILIFILRSAYLWRVKSQAFQKYQKIEIHLKFLLKWLLRQKKRCRQYGVLKAIRIEPNKIKISSKLTKQKQIKWSRILQLNVPKLEIHKYQQNKKIRGRTFWFRMFL